MIFLLLIIGWFVFSLWVARAVTKNARRYKWLKFTGLGFVLAILPYTEEIYVVTSFRAYCNSYAGITKLNPVKAYAVEVLGYWNPMLVIENNAIDIAYSPIHDAWLSKKKTAVCTDSVHEELLSYDNSFTRLLAKKITAEGYCYYQPKIISNVKVLLSGSDIQEHTSHSAFMVTRMEEKLYQVIDETTLKVLSEYVILYADPGKLRQKIWSYFSPYSCTLPPLGNIKKQAFPTYLQPVLSSFSVNQKPYQFLTKAILLKE